MSTAWDLGCFTCDTTSGIFDVNHGEDQIAEVILAATGFAGLPEQLPWILDGCDQAISLGRFFREHAGHDVRPKDEYGRWSGECGKYERCAVCGHQWKCRLPVGHTVECAPQAPPA